MNRRDLLKYGAISAAVMAVGSPDGSAEENANATPPFFSTANVRWQQAYDRALNVLANNVQVLPRFPDPVLIEGSSYAGIWQECGPHESLVYRHFRPDVARNGHLTFFALQRPDGQLPANNKRSETGFGQIQMVVPIAATAWELAQATGDSELLDKAYDSCARWDAWLMQYRNTRGTGLIEGFCTYDTGMDNSPRWAGFAPQCPGKDARRCPDNPALPRLCPDLSATVYGARIALASMATDLGQNNEAAQWHERAETLRGLILQRLYDSEDAAFYDVDAQGHFVKVRSDILSRICGEHVVDRATFAEMWERQLGNPHAFWALFPLPSIALDDPAFVRPIPRNSWGGASQALTALRAGRWMDFYGRSAEFAHMQQQWCEALQRDMTFREQLNPLTGKFTQADEPDYSPAALVMYDYTWRLAGLREEGDELHWNVRPGCATSMSAIFRLTLSNGKSAEMHYTEKGAEIALGGRKLGQVTGVVRVVTDKTGRPLYALGIDLATEPVEVRLKTAHRRFTLPANARENLA